MAYGEFEDVLDQLKMKCDGVDRRFDRLAALGMSAKNKVERDQVTGVIERDIEKVVKELYRCEEKDLKKMTEEKREEYGDRLVKLKLRTNKLKAKIDKYKTGGGLGGDNSMKEPLIQNDGGEVELLDLETADQKLVGEAGMMLQAKSKQALSRIIAKQEQMNQMAPEMLLEVQKQNERIMKIDEKLN